MMAEMLAALLALSIAMGTVGAVAQLATVTERAHQAAISHLADTKALEAVLDRAVDVATPGNRPWRRLAVARRLAFACGGRGVQLCEVATEAKGADSELTLRINGQVVAAAPLDGREVLLVAGVTEEDGQGVARLSGAVMVAPVDAVARPLAVAAVQTQASANCRYDPTSFSCAPGSR